MSPLASFPLFSLQQSFLDANPFDFNAYFVEDGLLAVDWFERYLSFEDFVPVRIKL